MVKNADAIREKPLLSKTDLKWTTVHLSDVLGRHSRLEASVFDIEGKHAREVLHHGKYEIVPLSGDKGLITAYHRPRFRRIFVEKSDFPIFQPSQITEIYPKPHLWISGNTETDIDSLRVRRSQILLTCSGTIGKCAIVTKTLENQIFSHDGLRITAREEHDTGYIYAFLKTNIGQVLLKTNNYGAVVQHIEPEHLEQVSIPNPPSLLKRNIHTRVMDSFKLRDESNALIDEAQRELAEELKLPALEKLAPKRFTTFGLHAFSAKLSNLHGRFEGTFHTPLINNITQHLREHCDEVTTVGDERISKRILLPGRFKRIYVEEGQGVVFFGGKQLLELDPTGEKFLSLSLHSNRIHGDLRLSENMVLVSRSGTIGKVNIVPKHWVNWIANEHIIRIIPQSDDLAGYIFAWLDSEFGYELIRRFSYGSVVDELDTNQLSQVQIPLLRDKKAQASINTRVLTANEKRYQAYLLEQEAIAMVENMVILTGKKTTYPSSSISDRLHASVAEGQRNSKPV